MNRCFPHHVMASVPQQGQDCKQESFSDLLSSVLSPDEATVGFEAAACVDLSGKISYFGGVNLGELVQNCTKNELLGWFFGLPDTK